MKTLSFLIILLLLSLLLSCKKTNQSLNCLSLLISLSRYRKRFVSAVWKLPVNMRRQKSLNPIHYFLLSFVCYTGEKEISRVSMFDCNRIGANCTIRSDSIFIDFDRISGTKVGCNSSLGYYRSFLDTTTYIYRNDTLFLKSTKNDTLILLKHERGVQ